MMLFLNLLEFRYVWVEDSHGLVGAGARSAREISTCFYFDGVCERFVEFKHVGIYLGHFLASLNLGAGILWYVEI
jgi:hypothetical protein